MAALDRDYALGIGVQLQTESIAALESQLQAAADNIKPIKIRNVQISPEQNGQLQKMLSEQQAIVNEADAKIKAANEQILQAWQQRTNNVGKQLSEENAIIEQKLDQQNALLESNAKLRHRRNQAIVSGESVGGTLVSGRDGGLLEKQQKLLDRYVPQLNAATKAHKGLNEQIFASSGAVDHLLQSMGNIAAWTIGAGALFAAGGAVVKGFQDAIHSQQEQVIQGAYYGAQGKNFTPQMSDQTMKAAIDLARTYGDEVVKTQEALGLWAKVTKGEFLPSLQMANDALKLNAVTGMDNEEIFRSTIATLSQYHESLARTNDLWNVGVGLATRYGGGIKMIGGEAQDAARQMLEGMDTSAAVASSFGLKMEQAAAVAAILIQTKNAHSGQEAGNEESSALAALDKGKALDALTSLGISTHNNPKILDEISANLNTEVPKMGKTLNDVLGEVVRPSALEPLKAILGAVKQIDQATQEAYASEKSHPIDTIFEKMKETDAYKINQLKASFEAISITIARQFLPALKDGMDEFERLVPTLIASGPQIAAVARDLLMLGAGWAAIEGFKILGSVALTAAGQWKTFANVLNGSSADISLSAQIASTAMSSEQRQAIATLTSNGPVTEEMATQWKALAISQGVSIDAMIAAMAKLQVDTKTGAASVIMSEDSISTNMEAVATQMGVEKTQVVAAFDGMAVGAESATTAIKTAFLSIMPVIGQVIVGGMIASQVAGWAISQSENQKLSADSEAAKAGNVSLRNEDIAFTREKVRQIDRDILYRRALIQKQSANGGRDGIHFDNKEDAHTYISELASQIAHDESDKQHDVKYLYAASHGQSDLTGTADLTVQQQLALFKKQSLDAFRPSGPANPTGDGSGSGSGSGAAQALNAEGDAVQRHINLLTKKDAADHKNVETAKLQIKIMSDKSKAIENLGKAYEREISDRQADIAVGQHAVSQFNNLAAHATTGSQQQKFLNKANDVQANIQTLQAQVQYLKAAAQVDVNNQLGSLLASKYTPLMAQAKESMKNMTSGMKLKTETVPDLESLHSILNEDLYLADRLIKTFTSKGDTKDANLFKSWAETLKSDLSTAGTNIDAIRQKASDLIQTLAVETHGNLINLAFPGDKAVDKYEKALDAISVKMAEYKKIEAENPTDKALADQVTQWQNTSFAVANATYAVDAYQEKLRALQNTPTYAAVSALGNDVGASLTKDVLSSFTNSDNNQVYAIETQIATLQNEKNLLAGRNNEIERMMLEQHIRQLEADKSGIEQRMKNPGFIKSIEEDMAKAMMKGLTDRLTKDLQDSFINSILGKNPADSPQVIATNTNTQAIKNLTDAMNARIGNATSGNNYGVLGLMVGDGAAQQMIASLPSASSSVNIPGIGSLPTVAGLGLSSILAGQSSGDSAVSPSALASIFAGSSAGGASALTGGGSSPSSSTFNFSGSVPSAVTSAPGGMPLGTNGGGSMSPATSAILAATAIPGVMGTLDSWGNPQNAAANAATTTGGSTWSGGFRTANGKINTAGITQLLGGGAAALQGYDQGGFAGSAEAGLGLYSAMTSSLFSGGMAAFLGTVAPYAAAALFFASLFHPHYNPSQNPDMYADSGFAQGVADAQGFAYTQANGNVYEDPGLKQQLGGMTELQYMDAWYNTYPGGNGLNTEGKQLWDEIGSLTGNGKGIGVEGLHQGNVFVSDGHGNKVGESGNWQTVLKDIDTYTQDLYALENQDMTGKGTWVSVNSYGAGGGGSADFSPWYSPGLSSSDIGAVTAMPYPSLDGNATVGTTVSPSPGSPSGGTGGGGGYGPGSGGGAQPLSVGTSVYLNSDVIAQQVNAFNIQRQSAGWAMNY